jgi:hypothetical protein
MGVAAPRLHVAVAALVAAAPAGCSFLWVDGPPGDEVLRRDARCTTSRAAPIADTVVTTLLGVDLLLAVGDGEPCKGDCPPEVVLGFLLESVVAGATLVSMIHGYLDAGRCRDLVARRAADRPREDPFAGRAGGHCLPNATCDEGLVCLAGSCAPGPADGTDGGRCFRNHTCHEGLACLEGRCAAEAP